MTQTMKQRFQKLGLAAALALAVAVPVGATDINGGLTSGVLNTIEESGGNPCPPLVVGVGVGGSAEYAMYLAKKAITRQVGEHSPDEETAEFERELLEKVNALGVGPQAVGGSNTAMAVNIETYPTHITSLPVAVNLQCHSARSKSAEL